MQKDPALTVSFNHAIVFAKDNHESASFFTRLFALPDAVARGPFLSVKLANGTFLQFAAPDIEIQPQHVAFLVTADGFDGIYDESRKPNWNTQATRRGHS